MKHAFTRGNINSIMSSVIYCMLWCYTPQDPAIQPDLDFYTHSTQDKQAEATGYTNISWVHLCVQYIIQTCINKAFAVCKYSTVSKRPRVYSMSQMTE